MLCVYVFLSKYIDICMNVNTSKYIYVCVCIKYMHINFSLSSNVMGLTSNKGYLTSNIVELCFLRGTNLPRNKGPEQK